MTGRERWLQTISDFLMFANEIVPSSLSSVSSYLKLLFKSSYTNITRVVEKLRLQLEMHHSKY